jgi:hypothetical protein
MIPSSSILTEYIVSFFDIFPSQMPCFHLPTFDLDVTEMPLLLSILSVGALQESDKDISTHFHKAAIQSITSYV